MGAIVLDTNAIVRAILSPAGARRRLWLLLVYGGAVQRAKQIRDEIQFARDAGLGESSTAGAFLERAEAAVEHIARLLPPDAPDDLWAVASLPLLAEYHRKLHDLRDKLARPPWTKEQVDLAYRAIVASCGNITPAFAASKVPHYTEGRDRDDDIVIHTALLGSADVLISNDTNDISLDRDGETEYKNTDGDTVRAMTFEHFANHHLGVDLDSIDGKRLGDAYTAASMPTSKDVAGP